MIKCCEIKSLKELYNIKAETNAQLVYYTFESAQIVIFKLLPPLNKSFYGVKLYSKLLTKLNTWAINSVDDLLMKKVIEEYHNLQKFVPASLNPASFVNEIELFVPIHLVDRTINYFISLNNEFKEDSFIDKQWSLSSPVMGDNYDTFILFNPNDKNLDRLCSLYFDLLSNKNLLLYTNKNIRFQFQTSLSLFSYKAINLEAYISNADIVLMGIVNILRWPNLYACVDLIFNQIKNIKDLNVEFRINNITLNYYDELNSYVNHIENNHPTVLSVL